MEFKFLDYLNLPAIIVNSDNDIKSFNSIFIDLVGFKDPKLNEIWPESSETNLNEGMYVTNLHIKKRAGNEFSKFFTKVFVQNISSKLKLLLILDSKWDESSFHKERLQTMGLLASGVAHDLNNVLAGILGHTSYLKRILPKEGQHAESLVSIEEGGKKASQLTSQILNFTRLESSDDSKQFDLCTLTQKTCNLLRGAISPEYSLHCDVPTAPIYLDGSEAKLSQVIINLAINARDASPRGARISVLIESEGENFDKVIKLTKSKKISYALISVTDEGTGIDKKILDKIFEPYFSHAKTGGTGLGLSTVHTIIQEINGTIHIDSTPNQGTTVFVLVPISEKITSSEVSTKAVQSKLHVGKILVVDDEDPVRNVISMSLKHLGFEVELANSGIQAIEKFNEFSDYDLVILDMLMPKMSGDQAFFKLKEINPNIKVLVISGYSSEESVQKILDNGGKGFLHKPFTIEELEEKIKLCL